MSNQEARAEMNGYLRSLTHTNPSLALDEENVILYTRPVDAPPKVSIIIASALPWGARPATLVGPGLASACVCIENDGHFNSVDALSRAIQSKVDASRGILVLIPQGNDFSTDIQPYTDVAKTQNPHVDIEILTGPVDKSIDEAGFYLLAKICGALAAACWPLANVMTVARLVNQNMLSVGHMDQVETLNGHIPTFVQGALRDLLHPEHRDPSFVHVNSNEVVLNITLSPLSTRYERGHIVDAIVSQLRDDWNIRPVRVFTNIHWLSNTFTDEDTHFSITLLNVCNTDIGGPSMIQLLDAPCEAEGWNVFAHKDSWKSQPQRETTRAKDRTGPSEQAPTSVAKANLGGAGSSPEIPATDDTIPAAQEAGSDLPDQTNTSSADVAATTASKPDPTNLNDLPAPEKAPTPAEQAEEHKESIVDALQIKEADFNAAIESIRQRELVPRPTRQLDDSSLIDMVREQVKALGMTEEDGSKQESGAVEDSEKHESDRPELDEDYEMV